MAAGEIMTTTATIGVATTSITVDTGTGTAGTTVGRGAGTTKHQPNENGGGVREQRPRRLAYHPLVGGQRGSTALADHRLDGRGVVFSSLRSATSAGSDGTGKTGHRHRLPCGSATDLRIYTAGLFG